jgi:hypothetical protein
MNHLKDLPPDTIWPHLLEAIERDVIAEIQSYAESRRNDVNRGAETPELAAVIIDKYAEGLSIALKIVGVDSRIRAVADKLVREIDPEFDQHRQVRWLGRPTALISNNEERHIGRFFVRNELFEQVKVYMATSLGSPVTNNVVENFLANHPELLGSIVGYDEVDTEDRSRIWDYCRSDFPEISTRGQ